jgi:hypothetical protein
MSWITDAVVITKEEKEIKYKEQLVTSLENAIDKHVDDVAKAKGYGTVSMSPTAACISYAGYPNVYQNEAIAFSQWKADIWPLIHQIYADVENGIRPIPSAEEILSEIPEMVWPS